MRMDLPGCDLHDCRYYFDGNCIKADKGKRWLWEECPHTRASRCEEENVKLKIKVEELNKSNDVCTTMGELIIALEGNKWHDLRKNPDDLPETLHPVYAKLDSGTYVFAYYVNKTWRENDDSIILHHGDGRSEVIAWREIPRFEEEQE